MHVRIRSLIAPVLLLAALAACGADAVPAAPQKKGPADFGIEVTGVHVSAAGYMLDFRYKVLDAAKALPLLAAGVKTYLVDQATGAVLGVPSTAKVGSLRQTSREAVPGRVYFTFFANPGAAVKPGAKVTVVMGDMHAPDLVVE